MQVYDDGGFGGQLFLLVKAQRFAHQVAEAAVVAALDGEFVAVVSVDLFDIAGCGAEHPERQLRLFCRLPAQQGREPGGGAGHLALLQARKAHDAQPAERRVQPQLPVSDLLLEEGVVVLRGGEVEHRVVGVGGLDDGKTGVFGPAAPAHHLRDEAEHGLIRPEALGEQERVDAEDAHQGHILEIQPLGHHLGAHHDVVLAAGEPGQQLFVGVLGGGGVLVHPQDACLREELCQLLLSLLGAEAAVLQCSAAGGAFLRGRVQLAAAVVTEQLVRRFVVDHRDAALCAFEHLAAVFTLGDGLVAPAVEQQDGLLFRFQIAADGIFERQADLARVAGGQLGPHIDDLDMGQRVAAVPLGQPHQLGAPMLGCKVALGAGGRAGQQEQCPILGRALPGHLVGGVAGRGFGTVGVLLLLVDDDEADVFQRREDGAAGAHHDVGPAVLDHLPLEQPFRVVEGRVLHGHPPAELALQPQDHLGGQADLRYKHQRPPPQLQTPLDELEEDQRFAAAGHAVEQRRMGFGIFEVRQQGIVCGLLFARQKDGVVFQRDARIQVDGFVHLAAFQHALGAEIVQHSPADALFFEFGLGALSPAQQGHRRQLLGRRLRLRRQGAHQLVSVLSVADQLLLQHRRHTVRRHGGLVLRPIRDDGLDGLIVGAEGAFFQKMRQPQQFRRQAGGSGGHIEEEFQLRVLRFGVAGQHHTHPGTAPPPERHQHHAAQPDGVLLVGHDRVGIQFIEVERRVAHGDSDRFWHSASSGFGFSVRGPPAGR